MVAGRWLAAATLALVLGATAARGDISGFVPGRRQRNEADRGRLRPPPRRRRRVGRVHRRRRQLHGVPITGVGVVELAASVPYRPRRGRQLPHRRRFGEQRRQRRDILLDPLPATDIADYNPPTATSAAAATATSGQQCDGGRTTRTRRRTSGCSTCSRAAAPAPRAAARATSSATATPPARPGSARPATRRWRRCFDPGNVCSTRSPTARAPGGQLRHLPPDRQRSTVSRQPRRPARGGRQGDLSLSRTVGRDRRLRLGAAGRRHLQVDAAPRTRRCTASRCCAPPAISTTDPETASPASTPTREWRPPPSPPRGRAIAPARTATCRRRTRRCRTAPSSQWTTASGREATPRLHGLDARRSCRTTSRSTASASEIGPGRIRVSADVANFGAGHSFPTGVVDPQRDLLVITATWNSQPLPRVAGPTMPFWGSDDVPGEQPGDYAGQAGKGFAKVLEGRIDGRAPPFARCSSSTPKRCSPTPDSFGRHRHHHRRVRSSLSAHRPARW